MFWYIINYTGPNEVNMFLRLRKTRKMLKNLAMTLTMLNQRQKNLGKTVLKPRKRMYNM